MKINKINSSSMLALAFGALLTAFPAIAETITFTTGPSPQSNFGAAPYNYTFLGADVSTPFDPTTNGGTFFSSSLMLSDSFGMIGFKSSGTPNGTVVNVDVTPTINGVTAATAIDFSGTVAVNSGSGVSSVLFSGGNTEVLNGQTYVYQVSNGVQYAIEQVQSLPTNSAKASYLVGFVGVVPSLTPEPATVATTGLALVLAGLIARRKSTATAKN